MAVWTCRLFFPHGTFLTLALATTTFLFANAALAQDIRQPQRPTGARPTTQRGPGAMQPSGGPGAAEFRDNERVPAGNGGPIGPVGPATIPRSNIIGNGAPPQQMQMRQFVRQPAWAPLPVAQQQHLDQVLDYWEKRSSKIKTYQCKFKRWKYDPVFLPAGADGKEKPIEYSVGEIRYAVPDKALYKDAMTQVYDVAKKEYKKLEDGGHHWICDGENIIEMVAVNKQMIKTTLPPNMRGEALRSQGPLPFLFGAKANEIKQRYWVRQLAPPEGRKEYHLEAVPKFQADAATYQKVLIVLDGKTFLPANMVVYNVNWNPRNPSRTSYKFEDSKENPISILDLNPWRKDFFAPPLPKDWKVVNVQPRQQAPAVAQRPGAPAAGSAPNQTNAPPGVSRLPTAPVAPRQPLPPR